jgi:hypothetical protein
MREAPIIAVIERLLELGARIHAIRRPNASPTQWLYAAPGIQTS